MSRRKLNALTSSKQTHHPRNISHVSYKHYQDHKKVVSGMCELDSHADTCVAGANCVILEETNQLVNVSAFSEHLDTMKNVPIVTMATAYNDPNTGVTLY
jgi:hypothetical protein